MKKIYITGSNGMVGRNLVDKLNNDKRYCIICKTLKELDLINRENVFDFFEKEKPDYVIHLAVVLGSAQDKIDHPIKYLRDNLLINTNLIDACAKFNIKKLIILNSVTIYPTNIKQPIREEDFVISPTNDINEGYALSKIVAIKLCEYYNRQKNTNFINLIAPNLYGKYDNFTGNSQMITSMMNKLYNAKKNNEDGVCFWGTGNARRELLFTSDLIDKIIFTLENIDKNKLTNGMLNCGVNEDISIRDLASLLKKITNFEGKISFDSSKPEGVKKRLMDSSRLNTLIGNQKHTNIEEGLTKAYKYFLNEVGEKNE